MSENISSFNISNLLPQYQQFTDKYWKKWKNGCEQNHRKSIKCDTKHNIVPLGLKEDLMRSNYIDSKSNFSVDIIQHFESEFFDKFEN